MSQFLRRVRIMGFRSLRDVNLELGPLTVLVGPNGAGKTTVLTALRFLGDVARLDLEPAVREHGGMGRLQFRGPREKKGIAFLIEAQVTPYASGRAPDDYRLTFAGNSRALARQESFQFKRKGGPGRRITLTGNKVEWTEAGREGAAPDQEQSLSPDSALLSTLPKLGPTEGGAQIKRLGDLFKTFRVFEVDVAAARRPSATATADTLDADAANLAAFLAYLKAEHPERFAKLEQDLRAIVPGIKALHVDPVGGADEGALISLSEVGLRGRSAMAEASFGTVRALALLALLHDPNPPKLTCIEEIDHGLHPYALDRIVERLRTASKRTQLIVATHSPSFVNRLAP
ncbi:MAG: AAA family ATPase, partial [Myxococcales bacterium]|nr:AAA family ATPase [Myxococcales bacterium]